MSFMEDDDELFESLDDEGEEIFGNDLAEDNLDNDNDNEGGAL